MNTEKNTNANGKEVLNEDKHLEYEMKLYEECCISYHRVDDFRAKLLGFLPVVTGAGIFVSLSNKNNGILVNYLPEIGIFGTIVTLGLLVYELKGIQKCTQFIKQGIYIEHEKFHTEGQFFALCKNASPIFNEPVASALVYSAVLAAWTYVSLYKCPLNRNVSGFIFIISAAFVYFYWKHVCKDLNEYLKIVFKNSNK